MPHTTAPDTRLPVRDCDPHRIPGRGPADVTPLIGTAGAPSESSSRTAFDLLGGRYLHTASGDRGRVSSTFVGNDSSALPDAKAWSVVDRVYAASEDCGRRSGRPAVDLTVTMGAVGSIGQVAMRRRRDGMTKRPATIRAQRGAVSMARPAPADIDVAEVHDSITGALLISYEGVGFAEPTVVSALMILEGPVADGR